MRSPRLGAAPLFPAAASRRIIALVTDAASIQRLLGYLGESTQALRIALAPRGPPG
ncbi:MAG: hypothetical protein LC647_17695 [Beggiatoa sp.]|nr:hypothetical protein [Beggiatoa sp.]